MPATTSSGNGYIDALQAALQAYATYKATQPVQLKQVPEDPGMVALRNQIIGYTKDSPTRDLIAGMLGPAIQRSSTDSFHLPQGANGYNPYPNGGAANNYDMSKILTALGMNSKPALTSQQSGGVGVSPESGSSQGTRRNLDFVNDSIGGPGPATMPEYDPNKNVGANSMPGGVNFGNNNSINPTGDSASQFSPANLPPGMSYADGQALQDFAGKYGLGAAQTVVGIILQNPGMTIAGATRLWHASQQPSNPTPTTPRGGGIVGPGGVSLP